MSGPVAASPAHNEDLKVDANPSVNLQDGSRTSSSDSWAVPAAVVLLLLLAAGVGLGVIYRRRRASRYHGLHEAELGEVRRSI